MAVHYLAMKGHSEAINDIARVGGYLDHCDREGITPLELAIMHQRTIAVTTLLRCNCDPNAPNSAGNSVGNSAANSATGLHAEAERLNVPLRMALSSKQYGIAQQLLLGGCRYYSSLQPVIVEYLARKQEQELAASSVFVSTGTDMVAPAVNSEEDVAMGWFAAWMKYPPSLKQACRVKIRACVRPKAMYAAVEELGQRLPVALRNYINLCELDEHARDGKTIHP